MSAITARKQDNRTTCYQFTCTDDEIIDENFLQLSDDSETWLCKTEFKSDRKSSINGRLDFGQDNGALDSSCRHFDSRTYTRRKRCSIQPSLESCWESPTPINTTQRSSLGLLFPSQINRTQDTDLIQDILKFTPIVKHRPERDSLDCTGSETTGPKQFQLDLSSLTPELTNLQRKTNIINTTFDKSQADIISDITAPSFNDINTVERSVHNNLTTAVPELSNLQRKTNIINTTFEKSQADIISDTTAPSFSDVNTVERSVHNNLPTAVSSKSLEYNQTDINNMTNLSKEILHCTYEAENIAPAVNLNTTATIDKPFNLTKTNINTNQTILSQTKSPNMQLNGTVNISKMNAQENTHKSPLNTTFPKSTNSIFSKILNNTFTKSADALNGGAEDDQISSASDSSFSSCSNLLRSVTDLHMIARLQEESLDEPEPERHYTPKSSNSSQTAINGVDETEHNNSTPKSNSISQTPINGKSEQQISTPKTSNMGRRPIDDVFCEESLSPITKSGDDGSKSSHNNTKSIPHPITSLMGDHTTRMPVNGINSTITRPKVTSRLSKPIPVSQLPVTRMIRPAVRNAGTGIRPTSSSATSIPRPASRLPAPRFRGRCIPNAK